MIVVATTKDDVDATRRRLDEFGVRSTRVVAPNDARRLVLGATEDDSAAERVAVMLRADGMAAVTRPDGGARLEAWCRATRPVRFSDRLTVCVAWSEHDRHDVPGLVELGPGGFGNGEHPSTTLLVETLLARIEGGERVLDVGCGSGILGLCALRLGAAHVVAVDVKAEAVAATRRSAILNDMAMNVDAIDAPLATIDGPFDVILANVGRAVIVELSSELRRLLAADGWLAVSGFSPPQCSLVAGFLRPLVEVEGRTSGEWAAAVFASSRHYT